MKQEKEEMHSKEEREQNTDEFHILWEERERAEDHRRAELAETKISLTVVSNQERQRWYETEKVSNVDYNAEQP